MSSIQSGRLPLAAVHERNQATISPAESDELIAALDAARGTATRAFPQKAILTPRQQSSMLLQRCRRSPISRTIAPTSL